MDQKTIGAQTRRLPSRPAVLSFAAEGRCANTLTS